MNHLDPNQIAQCCMFLFIGLFLAIAGVWQAKPEVEEESTEGPWRD